MIGMLQRDLPLHKQQMLRALTAHPGFAVLKELIADALDQASRELFSLDPKDPDHIRKLTAIQNEAHAIKVFSEALIRSIDAHIEAVISNS